VGAHGIRGELTVEILTDDPHRFDQLERVYLGREGREPAPWRLLGHRYNKELVLLRLEGCEDRTAAEALRGSLVQIPLDEAIALEEGEYFEHQILGLEAWSSSGERLGSVVEIIYTGANDVYVIRDSSGTRDEILVPAISGVVLQIDLAAGRLVVDLPEGLV
jgi:16S rRNA processing protein RimM